MPGTLLDTFAPDGSQFTRTLKVSSGIGDNDGFPALDAYSDDYATKEKSKWGFLVTGGAEFHMPLTIYQVASIGLAAENDLHVGDIILEINEEDATQLTLSQAREKLEAAKKKLILLVKTGMSEEHMDYETGEERNVVLRMPKPVTLPEFVPTPLLGSRCWHPIMWQDPPAPPKPKKKKTKTEVDDMGNEVVIELSEDESSEEEEEEVIRLAIENRLTELQYKLSELAEIPNILSSALETVGEVFQDIMWSDTILEPLTEVSTDAEDDNSSCCEESSFKVDNGRTSETPSLSTFADSDNEDSEKVYNFKIKDEPLLEDELTTSLTLHLKKRKDKLIEEESQEADNTIEESKESTVVQTPKLGKLESAWPWADRQKIIYKQSTCHLMSNKVLGLVEQRMQLLEKNHKKHEI